MSKTIVNTDKRIYWFDEDLILREITQTIDPFYDVSVLEPVNEGQFRNLYIVTNNYRTVKNWNGEWDEVRGLSGLSDIQVARVRTLEVNNNHLICANIAKYGSGSPDAGRGLIDEVSELIDTVDTIIDVFGLTVEQGYKRFNKTIVWSNILQPEVFTPTLDNQAGDIDIDEDGGEIVRIKKLAELNIIYKANSIWLLIHVGLPYVFVKKFYTASVGLLAVNCIVEIANVHYFVGHDFDIYRFDGVNVANLSSPTSIKEYIKSEIDFDKIYASHALVDIDRKEIEFVFFAKQDITKLYDEFSVVYNYESNLFSRRDSIAKCGGYFLEGTGITVIDDVDTIIDNIDIPIDSFRSGVMIDSVLDMIDSIHDPIDQYGEKGVPRRKLLIGDRHGWVYLHNYGDSFDGEDIYAYYETGDEDYSAASNRTLDDHTKLIRDFLLLIEDQGVTLDLDLYIGTKMGMDGKLYWKGPYPYKQDGQGNGRVKLKADGNYHRFRFVSKFKGQYIRILGYVIGVDDYGRVIR